MLQLEPTDIAHGGESVARLDGKAHFVAGAIPGEVVTGEIVVDKGAWARVELRDVVEPSADRIDPPCPHFASCGGCQWQFMDYAAQLRWKQRVVAGQLEHLGRIVDPPVAPTLAVGEPYGYRNRMDFRVSRGQPALHGYRSRQLVPLEVCLLLHPQLQELFAQLGDLSDVEQLTVRVSATDDTRLVVVTGAIPSQAAGWDADVVARRGRRLDTLIGLGVIHETVAGVDFRITADAFFQNNTAGAEALVGIVREAVGIESGDTVLDAYAGGGLFAATVGANADRVVAVEASGIAFNDLQSNLRRAGLEDVRAVKGDVAAVVPRLDEYWHVVIVDPPRSGLGRDAIDAVTAAGPHRLVYVSCDPASLGRDARLLSEIGFRLESAQPVDLFPQTYHIETVAVFAAA